MSLTDNIRPGLSTLLLALLFVGSCRVTAGSFGLHYRASIDPASGEALVSLSMSGERLPSQLQFHSKDQRYNDFHSTDGPVSEPDKEGVVTWTPEPDKQQARLEYRFQINHQRDSGRYDSRITDQWAILRSDKLVPPISARMPKGLRAQTTLSFDLPAGWSAAAPYEKLEQDDNSFLITDPKRRFVRPKGWLILGHISSRSDDVRQVNVRVAAPRGQGSRLQDSLAFIRWTLPYLRDIFPDFPEQMLVVTAGDPMWRGGLSSPNSLFMHADRPLISGNRTASLIHEMVHIGTSIHGTRNSDWIVEGIAEFYAVEILRRSGAISEQRYRDTLDELARWGKESEQLFTGDASGATTARAVGVMYEVDRELRARSDDQQSLDDVARALARQGGKISVKDFVETADTIAGEPLTSLSQIRARINND